MGPSKPFNNPPGRKQPENQPGFRKGRGTTDMIFAARQLQEKCLKQCSDLYSIFVELTKAFDTVCREGLWKITAKFECPGKFISIVRQVHAGMFASRVLHGDLYEPFELTNGAKHGCVLGPTFFLMLFSAILCCAFMTVKMVSA